MKLKHGKIASSTIVPFSYNFFFVLKIGFINKKKWLLMFNFLGSFFFFFFTFVYGVGFGIFIQFEYRNSNQKRQALVVGSTFG